MSLSPNIVTNKFSVKERWLKLYRKIHNLFLKDEFIHKVDYLKTIALLNARITELEGRVTVEQVKIAGHTHLYISPMIPATGPPIPTVPASASLPGYQPASVATKPVVHETSVMEATDKALMGTGPAMAPMADGITPEAQLANVQAKTDIGF